MGGHVGLCDHRSLKACLKMSLAEQKWKTINDGVGLYLTLLCATTRQSVCSHDVKLSLSTVRMRRTVFVIDRKTPRDLSSPRSPARRALALASLGRECEVRRGFLLFELTESLRPRDHFIIHALVPCLFTHVQAKASEIPNTFYRCHLVGRRGSGTRRRWPLITRRRRPKQLQKLR